jgi:hypothetical protein
MPRGLRNLPISFEESHLTHFAGLLLIQRFCQKLGIKHLLQQHLRPAPRFRDFHPSEMILAVLYAIIAGMERVNETQILQYNGAFQRIVGLSRFPDQTAIRRFLKRLTPRHIRQIVQVHDLLRQRIFNKPSLRTSLIFDLDSTVLVVYGKSVEGARVGYNPKKHGRRSYHPLLAFESRSQEFWHGSLRPGDAGSSTGAVPFIKVCLTKVPKRIPKARIRFRMDSGFYGKRVVEFLDGGSYGYVIVAKAKKRDPVTLKARGCRFTRLQNGWEVGEFWYRPHRWEKRHRYVVVRRPIPEEPEEADQLTLFKDVKYAYHIFVTNLIVSAWRVYLFYSPRARIEKHIRELAYDYPLAKIPTQDWIPNVAFFQLLLFAFDIVHYFKRICLSRRYRHKTLKTLRMELLVLPGRLVKTGNRYRLTLPRQYHFQPTFEQALARVQKFKLPKLAIL